MTEPETGTSGLRPSYPIETQRLLLRPHRVSDLDDLLRFHSDPQVVRFVPWPVRDRAATEQALKVKLDQDSLTAPGQWLVLAVELRETSAVIGEVLLKWASAEHRQGELGFAFARDQHGRGLAAEAARAMLQLGFDQLGLHRISAVCVEQNVASARLLQRLGFTREARLVDAVYFKGQWTTQLGYALTEDTWRAGRPAVTDQLEADLRSIRELIGTFFAAFTSGEGVAARLDTLRAAMLAGAVIVRTCGQPATGYDIDAFIAPRRSLLTDGTLTDFTEHATRGRVDVFGDIAHWFGRYTKNGVFNDRPYPGKGMKSIQFVRTAEGWRISAVAWDDERDGLSLDDYVSAGLSVQAFD